MQIRNYLIISSNNAIGFKLADEIADKYTTVTIYDVPKLTKLKTVIGQATEETCTIGVVSDALFSEKSPQFFQKLMTKYQMLPIFISDIDKSLAAYIFHITSTYISSYLISIEENATEIPKDFLEALFDELETEDT